MVDKRCVIAFYGIRGVSSAYYLAYARVREAFTRPEYLWSVAGLTILVSILLHGTTVTPVMRRLDRHRARIARLPDPPKAFRSGQAT
jgi:NhaP-type Na+/H+ or K+/H+ antiporter